MAANGFYEALCAEEHVLVLRLEDIRRLKNQYEPITIGKSPIIDLNKDKAISERPSIFTKIPNNNITLNPYKKTALNPPKEFNKNLSQIQKTYYLISKRVSPANTEELTDDYMKLDNTVPRSKVKKFITDHASKYFNYGLIGAKKVNNRNLYFLE